MRAEVDHITLDAAMPIETPLLDRLRRWVGRVGDALLVVYLLYIVYTSLLPFDFRSAGTARGSNALFAAAVDRFTLPDIVANIFLYVPLGALLYIAMRKRLRRTGRATLLAAVLAAGLSLAVEWAQAFSAIRVSSRIDLAANALGGSLGALLAATCRQLVPRLAGTALIEVRAQPHVALLKGYCALLMVFAAIPFAFSLDVERLAEAARTATLIPFTEVINLSALMPVPGGLTTIETDAYTAYWQMDAWARWTAEAASFWVLGVLASHVLCRTLGFRRVHGALLIGWAGVLLAAALSIMQFFVLGRGFHTTDILMRVVGLGLGIAFFPLVQRFDPGLSGDGAARSWRRLARAAACIVALYIIGTGVMPFVPRTELNLSETVAAPSFLPFQAYFDARFDRMMRDLMGKTGAFILLGSLVAFAAGSMNRYRPSRRVLAAALVGLVLSLAIESAQLFLLVRVTSLTDPIVAVAGCALGAVAHEGLAAFWRAARSQELDRVIAGPDESRRRSPLDRLVASLADEHPDAPREPATRRRRGAAHGTIGLRP